MNWTSTRVEQIYYGSAEGSLTEIMFYAIVGGYALTSLLLLRFPYILHRRKHICFEASKISHRGGSGEGIENTIGCFENAIKVGSQMLEMDCHMTSDGEVVVVHDFNLSSLCERPVTVSSTPYKDLPMYKKRVSIAFAKGQVMEAGPNTDRKIPLLREVFEKFPEVPMNIDVKANDEELLCKVTSLVREFKREGITVIGSFSSHLSGKCQEMNPDLLHFCCFCKVLKILVSFYLGLLPFLTINESFFEIMMPSVGFDKNNCLPTNLKSRIFLRMVDFIIMNRFLFRHLQRRGIRVYVWVLNHEDQFERALAYGVDGIMTDYPSKLTSYMNGRGVRHPRTDNPAACDLDPLCEKGI